MKDHVLKPGTRLVVASHNKGKVWEINQLIAPYGLDAVSVGDLNLPEPEETEPTFEGNARLKALAAARGANLPALADDSGLEVECLNGAPGIYSARWAGPGKDFAKAMALVGKSVAGADGWRKAEAAGLPGPRANFISVICLAWPDGASEIFEGRVYGHLVAPPRGGNGFGYDPMFVPDGDKRTFGEMEPKEKYAVSHRTRAFAAFKAAHLAHLPVAAAPAPGTPDAAGLAAAAANISTRDELLAFVENLRAAVEQDGGGPDAAALGRVATFIEAAAETDPGWRLLAKALLAAGGRG